MSFASDLTAATMKWETEKAAATTQAQMTAADVRYHRRVLAAEANNSGNSAGSAAALQALGVDPVAVDDAAYSTAKTAHDAAMATLVSDGASPTQAHVTALNLAYLTLKGHVRARLNFTAADKTASRQPWRHSLQTGPAQLRRTSPRPIRL